MATNPTGAGTKNLPINFLIEERKILGRLASQTGARSVGDFVRNKLLDQLKITHPIEAAQIEALRAGQREKKFNSVLESDLKDESLRAVADAAEEKAESGQPKEKARRRKPKPAEGNNSDR